MQSHPDLLLRPHTSPVQIRGDGGAAAADLRDRPRQGLRRDSDATHSPMFHQVEGLAIGEGSPSPTCRERCGKCCGRSSARPRGADAAALLPLHRASVEFDVSCFQCEGAAKLADGERCNLCKGIGWIEVGGAGMVDPNVLGFVESSGYDSERVQGFAFGMGVERIAMLRHGVPDLRRFFDNDVRMLEQFS